MTVESKKTTKARCPTCDDERVCEVHGTMYKAWDWEDRASGHSVNGGVDHSLLECRGCETVFYETQSWNSEDIDPYYSAMGITEYEVHKEKTTYPKPDTKTNPAGFDAMYKFDDQLHGILNEMYLAYDNHAYILTAIGLRTALDRGTEVLGIDPAKTFDEKLTELMTGGWIGETEKNILKVVTDAGHAAAHRGWKPSGHEVAQLLYAMEVFLQRAFIIGQKALSIKANIPAKPRRRQAPTATPPAT